MTGAALDQVFREASARIVGALAARFRDLDLAEEGFAEACARACARWPEDGIPANPQAWLFQVARRSILDMLRRRETRERLAPDVILPATAAEDEMLHDQALIPDERLRLIFICCHPAMSPDSRALLTLRLVCGLTVPEIARAFLLSEATVAQRLVRAKRKIGAAGVPFELPQRAHWPERLESVLLTVEVAYSKAHEDSAGQGVHAGFAAEMLGLSQLLVELAPQSSDACALAATLHYAEARRPARTDSAGTMVALSRQDPALWRRDLIATADRLFERASTLDPDGARTLQAQLQAIWCRRHSLADPEPWEKILDIYDRLLGVRDDPVVRLNRAVALARVAGAPAGLEAIAGLDADLLGDFPPFHAVRADLLARTGARSEARAAYDRLLELELPVAERAWLEIQRNRV